ncbi:MAG: M23 family metallopeptidase [candidate division KSB1 bacterium]|nr:M23 family metallopeptidase [candidate division KSB1 bacterium]
MIGKGNKGRKKAGYSILIVPDDDRPTFSLHLSPRRLAVLKVMGLAVLVHVLVGLALYIGVVQLGFQNRRLRRENESLRAEAQRIGRLAEEFNRLEETDRKIRALLGLDPEVSQLPRGGVETRTAEAMPPVSFLDSPTTRGTATTVVGPMTLSLLTERGSDLQFLVANLPTHLPVEGVVTADFDPRGHYGIDIATRRGSVVRAAGAGLVVFAGWTPDLGNLIILYHGRGLFSYYGHNGKLLRSARDWVRKGEPIALVGSSGESSGPHLHFEIWLDGKPQDPKSYLLAFARPTETGTQASK